MNALPLLLVYGAALVLFSLAGGALSQRIHMTHTRAQLAMSLVSGLMLGIAFFHLLPHAGMHGGLNAVMGWAMLGLVVMLLLLRLLHFHQPDYYEDPEHVCDGGHAAEPLVHLGHVHTSWKGVLTGLTLHSLIDGVALGAAMLVVPHGHGGQLLGFGVFLAILLHKPLDAMSITALMQAAGVSLSGRRRANLLFALVCPLGAIAFYHWAITFGVANEGPIAAALAFSAGAFICIALSDLLPEVQFHSHDRVKLTLVFLLGIGLSWLMTGAAPDHSHALLTMQSASGG